MILSENVNVHKNFPSIGVVYGLIDPITSELRYVGISIQPSIRLRTHHSDSYKNRWIKSLINNGVKAKMIILEEHSSIEDLKNAEIDLISYYKFIGCNLTNLNDGGEGNWGWAPSEDTKSKIAASNTGKKQSLEHRESWKKANKGKPSPNKGNKASPELKNKLSLAHLGKQGKKRIFSQEQEIAIYNEYLELKKTAWFGNTIPKIAKKYEVSKDTIRRIFERCKKQDWSI